MKIRLVIIIFVSVFLSACMSLITPKVEHDVVKLKPGQYSLDTSHASILFKIQHFGISTFVGRFNTFDASLEFDPNKIADTRLSAVIEIDSFDANNTELKDDLMGRSWFHQSKYSQAVFESTSVRPISETEFEFSGVLNWRGVQKEITLLATFNGGAKNVLTRKYTIGFSAKTSFSRTDFGMGKFVPLVGDEVTIETHGEFIKN